MSNGPTGREELDPATRTRQIEDEFIPRPGDVRVFVEVVRWERDCQCSEPDYCKTVRAVRERQLIYEKRGDE